MYHVTPYQNRECYQAFYSRLCVYFMSLNEDTIKMRLASELQKWYGIVLTEYPVKGGRIDILADYRVVIEVKSKTRFLEDAKKQVLKYAKYIPNSIPVVTDGETYLQFANGKWKAITFDDLVAFAKPLYTPEDVARAVESLKSRAIEILREAISQKRPSIRTAYDQLMKKIYHESTEELFIYHSLIAIIINAFIEELVGTLPFDILPAVISWWRGMPQIAEIKEEARKIAKRLDPQYRGDIFRELYEAVIPRDVRRKIGEYYTPMWLVEYIVKRIVKPEDIVLDPFCGSGSFLVASFYHKVQHGREPEKAMKEVMGFDINPIAVAVARANLVIAFSKYTKNIPYPRVFLGDYATGEPYDLPELKRLSGITKMLPPNLRPEHVGRLHHDIREYLTRKRTDILEEICNELFGENGKTAFNNIVFAIDLLVKKYGDGVWAELITSIFVSRISVKPNVIVTNPPWGQVSAVSGNYGDKLRDAIRRYTTRITSADVSQSMVAFMLKKCKDSRMTFVMPAEAVFVPGKAYGLAKNITERMLKGKEWYATFIDRDVFGHGVLPSILWINMPGSFERMKIANGKPSLEQAEYISAMAYEEFMKLASKKYPNLHAMGCYIRGLYTGAAPVGMTYELKSYSEEMNMAVIDMPGLKNIRVSLDELRRNSFSLVYMGRVFPFYHEHIMALKKEYALKLVKKEKNEFYNVCKSEWKSPDKLKRTPVACAWRAGGTPVATVIRNEVIDSTCAFIECDTIEEAYYYSSLFNYMVFVLTSENLSFSRHPYARPYAIIAECGLEWHGEDWQEEVAKIVMESNVGEAVKKAVKEKGWKTVKKYFTLPEVKELMKRLDRYFADKKECMIKNAKLYGLVF